MDTLSTIILRILADKEKKPNGLLVGVILSDFSRLQMGILCAERFHGEIFCQAVFGGV